MQGYRDRVAVEELPRYWYVVFLFTTPRTFDACLNDVWALRFRLWQSGYIKQIIGFPSRSDLLKIPNSNPLEIRVRNPQAHRETLP